MPSAPTSAVANFLMGVRAAALDHGQALGMRGDVFELAAEPQIDMGVNR